MSGLELFEIKRESFQRNLDKVTQDATSILSLTLQLKQVEDHFSSVGNSIDQRFKQLHSVEESVKTILGELKLREAKLSIVQDAVEWRFKELARKETEFELMRRSGTSQKEIDRIQGFLQELELAKRGFDEGLMKLELQENKLLFMTQERLEHQARLEKKEKELEAKEKLLQELVMEYEFTKEIEKLSSSEVKDKCSLTSFDDEPQRRPCTRSKSKVLEHCDLIQNLIEKERRLQAIKHVCEFNMADKFSLPTLLQDHLRYVKRISKECREKDDSVPTQIVALTKEISDLKAMIKCIKLHKLEADIPIGKIERKLRKREKQKDELEKFGPCTRSKSKILNQPSDQCRDKRARLA